MRTAVANCLLPLILGLALAACDFPREADAKFGDQHFKTAIALIELHKVRYGSYPEDLKSLKFTGDWDPIALSAVEYRRMANGYELNLTRGWMGKPDMSHPADFWKGLGLVKTNIRQQAPAH